MKFTAIGRMSGDGTTPFVVTGYRAKTIVEFVNEVLENKQEWGYIEVEHEKVANPKLFSFLYCHRIEYRYGKLIKDIPSEWQNREIAKIQACGGWSRMDYYITPR